MQIYLPIDNSEELIEVAEESLIEIVEYAVVFLGGINGFCYYLKDEIKYWTRLRNIGAEGEIFVQFMVKKDVSLTEINRS